MNRIRNHARLVAVIAFAWHVVAIAAVSAALSCDSDSDHAGMPNCPLHQGVPACPIHAEKHGTHECDCPTIGCSQTDAGFMALFGTIAILPSPSFLPVPLDAGRASARVTTPADLLPRLPLSPPPRA